MNIKQQANEISELTKEISELKVTLQNAITPPDRVIYDDVQLREFLKISKRTTAYWREKGLITFSKLGGRIYYELSDILSFLKAHQITAIDDKLKISL